MTTVNIRDLLAMPVGDNREFFDTVHAILMSPTAHLSQKIVALRLLDGVIGTDGVEPPIGAAEVADYIACYETQDGE